MFQQRGYLLDTSRGKVPTMATLRRLVEILARFNYNELQITLTDVSDMPEPACAASNKMPFTPDELRELDAVCALHGLDLVPCFDPTHLPCAEEWPEFGAGFLNIGCGLPAETDSPFAPFAVEDAVRAWPARCAAACALACARGKRPMFWADAVLHCPELALELPKDAIALVRGYEGAHPFQQQTAKIRATGLDFCVCPGTSAWNSLAGRVENLRENLQTAESAGRRFGARGFLVADWGGVGHWQPLAASLPGLILGGVFAYDGAKAPKMDLEGALDAVMGVPLGGTLLRLGTLYLRGGALRAGESELFRILSNDRGYSRHAGLTDVVLAEIAAVAEGCRHDAAQYASGTLWGEGAVWAQEIMYMANLVDAACNRRDEKRLRFLREEHARVWRLRNREEGLADSLNRLPRF